MAHGGWGGISAYDCNKMAQIGKNYLLALSLLRYHKLVQFVGSISPPRVDTTSDHLSTNIKKELKRVKKRKSNKNSFNNLLRSGDLGVNL